MDKKDFYLNNTSLNLGNVILLEDKQIEDLQLLQNRGLFRMSEICPFVAY